MKVNAKSSAEKTRAEAEALAWAKDYFRNRADDVSRAGSKRFAEKEFKQRHIELYEDLSRERKSELVTLQALSGTKKSFWSREGRDLDKDDVNVRLSRLFNHRSGDYDPVEFAAILLERGERLPEIMRSYIAEFLRRNRKARKPGPKKTDLERRDQIIAVAVRYIIEQWGLEIIRNPLTKRASAASIIAASMGMSEKAVNKICNSENWSWWLRGWPIVEGDSASRRLESGWPRRTKSKARKRPVPQIKSK